MQLTGTIEKIFDTKQVSDKFSKREFVLEHGDNPQYMELTIMEFIQDKCGILDSYKAGDKVTVSINLKGRAWTNPKGETKYFNTIQAWKIEKVEGGQNDVPTAQGVNSPDSDDLPF